MVYIFFVLKEHVVLDPYFEVLHCWAVANDVHMSENICILVINIQVKWIEI